jgi:hypothetical protein
MLQRTDDFCVSFGTKLQAVNFGQKNIILRSSSRGPNQLLKAQKDAFFRYFQRRFTMNSRRGTSLHI